MRGERVLSGALVTLLASLLLTLAIAWPVVRTPSTRIFGTELDGRHHDPFTVMWHFQNGPPSAPYRQPLVDDAGASLARVIGPVAAFNTLVLLTFPLSAAATYVLARYLRISHAGGMVAAFAFAFAPIRLAHAAYHPHVAQTQWIPIYFLALWACIDRATIARALLLAVSAAALALSNLYGAFICAVVTPAALARHWLVSPGVSAQAEDLPPPSSLGRPVSSLLTTLLALVFIAAAGLLLIAQSAPAILSDLSRFESADSDLVRYGARWWAYIVPPIEHPVFGAAARRLWNAAGFTGAAVEQQLSTSWALLLLAAVATRAWMRRHASPGNEQFSRAMLGVVPPLALVASCCG